VGLGVPTPRSDHGKPETRFSGLLSRFLKQPSHTDPPPSFITVPNACKKKHRKNMQKWA
jgi:hypothetical protein